MPIVKTSITSAGNRTRSCCSWVRNATNTPRRLVNTRQRNFKYINAMCWRSSDCKGSGLQGFWLQGVKVLPKIRVWICSKGLRTSKQGLTLPNLTHSSTWNVSRSIDLPSIAWSKLKSAMHNCFHYFDRRNFNLKVCSHINYVHYTFTTYMIAFALASHTQLFMCMGQTKAPFLQEPPH